MAYINGFGQMVDGSAPSYIDQQIADLDARPWAGMPKRLPARTVRMDIQYCPEGWWATREGAMVKVTAMSDRHLLNAMKWMERTVKHRVFVETLRMAKYISNAPDHAGDACTEAMHDLYLLEDKMDNAVRADYKQKCRVELCRQVWPKYLELEAEKKRRGL